MAMHYPGQYRPPVQRHQEDEAWQGGHRHGPGADQDLHAGLQRLAAAQPEDQARPSSSRWKAWIQSRPDAPGSGQAAIERQVQDLLRREEAERAGQELRLPQLRGGPVPRRHGQPHCCRLGESHLEAGLRVEQAGQGDQ